MAVRVVAGLRTWLLLMVGTVTTAFCSWAFFVRQWSGRSRRRTATRTGVRSSFTGMEGWSPRPGWLSAHDGRRANPARNRSAKITRSLVMSSEVTVSGLTTPFNRRDRSRPPISKTNRSMMRWFSLEKRPVSSMMEGWNGWDWQTGFGGGGGGTSERSIVSCAHPGVVARGEGGGGE